MAEMTIQDSDSRECALLLRVSDRSLHAYIQQYPFCTGPDETLNRKCFGALCEQLEFASQRCRGLSNRWGVPNSPTRKQFASPPAKSYEISE